MDPKRILKTPEEIAEFYDSSFCKTQNLNLSPRQETQSSQTQSQNKSSESLVEDGPGGPIFTSTPMKQGVRVCYINL